MMGFDLLVTLLYAIFVVAVSGVIAFVILWVIWRLDQ